MAIKYTNPKGWIISHPEYFTNIKVKENDGELKSFKLNPDLFRISDQFILEKQCKNLELIISPTAKLVQKLSEQLLLNDSSETFKLKPTETETPSFESLEIETETRKIRRNELAVNTAKDFYEKNCNFEFSPFHGENMSPYAVLTEIQGIPEQFLFPQGSKFHCCDIMDEGEGSKLKDIEGTFDLIVLDPPWRNKFIRRRKRSLAQAGYKLLESEEIAKIPIGSMLDENGVVVIWCTNSKMHQDSLVKDIFPQWGLKLYAVWHWLKVTTNGTPICPFTKEGGKQPYETIIIGTKKTENTNQPIKLIISTPSAINSHKPPVTEVLESHFGRQFDSKCELFARYLLPGYTSYGNQVCKLQHLQLFVVDE